MNKEQLIERFKPFVFHDTDESEKIAAIYMEEMEREVISVLNWAALDGWVFDKNLLCWTRGYERVLSKQLYKIFKQQTQKP